MIKSAKPNLLSLHSKSNLILQNSCGSCCITKHNVGKLILPTGRIVMCSPDNEYAHIDDYSRLAFAVSVPRGEYPVTLYVSNFDNGKELAFAEICFRDTIPISYSEASTQKDIELKRKGYKGYVVNDDRTGLMDAEAFYHVTSQRTVIDYEEDDSFIEDEEIQSGLCNIISTPNNALLLSVRSGVYYWYWGKDKDKNICNLVGDFFSFN